MVTVNARESVLRVLRNANLDQLPGVSVKNIARFTGYPAASIRRTIAELKQGCWNIVREGKLVRLVVA
jgi:hypothetical protein